VCVLLCFIKPILGNQCKVQGFLDEQAKGARTHDWKSPTHHLTLTSLRQPCQLLSRLCLSLYLPLVLKIVLALTGLTTAHTTVVRVVSDRQNPAFEWTVITSKIVPVSFPHCLCLLARFRFRLNLLLSVVKQLHASVVHEIWVVLCQKNACPPTFASRVVQQSRLLSAIVFLSASGCSLPWWTQNADSDINAITNPRHMCEVRLLSIFNTQIPHFKQSSHQHKIFLKIWQISASSMPHWFFESSEKLLDKNSQTVQINYYLAKSAHQISHKNQ